MRSRHAIGNIKLVKLRAFSCDVTAAMLEGKNNTFSLPQPSDMAAMKTLHSRDY